MQNTISMKVFGGGQAIISILADFLLQNFILSNRLLYFASRVCLSDLFYFQTNPDIFVTSCEI